ALLLLHRLRRQADFPARLNLAPSAVTLEEPEQHPVRLGLGELAPPLGRVVDAALRGAPDRFGDGVEIHARTGYRYPPRARARPAASRWSPSSRSRSDEA